jgi:hypothetical protein
MRRRRTAQAQFKQNNLISNMPGLAATTDSSLVNPWGVSFAGGSPIWISNQGTNTSILPSVVGSTGVSENFTVNIPTTAGPAVGRTGQVANALAIAGMSDGFAVNNGGEWSLC